MADVTSPHGVLTPREERASDFDFCMIFPTDPITGAFSEKSEDLIKKIIPVLGTHNVHMYFSVDKGEIVVLLKLSDDRAKFYADLKRVKLLADESKLKEQALKGWPENKEADMPEIPPLELSENERLDITRFRPYQNIYLEYELEQEYQHLFKKHELYDTIFPPLVKLKIVQAILREPKEDHGLDLSISKLRKAPNKDTLPVLLHAFPLHNEDVLKALKAKIFSWKCFFPWSHPYDEIKDYFGEKNTLYYRFVGHFALWLVGPAIIGLAFELVVAGTATIGHPIIPFYSLFIVVWGVFMLEYWKRKERFTALKWGMIGYEEKETIRAEFDNYERISLTGEEVLYFSLDKKRYLVGTSFFIIFLFCCIVIGTTAAIYGIRQALGQYNKPASAASSIVASILNTIQIQIYTYLYGMVSTSLTDRENHKTDTEYEDSMIAKNFVFNFINSYSSFFFIAYFAEIVHKPMYPGQPPDDNVGMCGSTNCMQTLAINLGIVLGTGIVVNNTIGSIIPYFTYKNNLKQEMKRAIQDGAVMTPAEKESMMSEYDSKSLIADYMTIAILFGFMTLFISALPGATFICFLSLWLEIKSDAWRMMTLTQRPWPSGGEDIGTWQSVFDMIIAAAVITNGAMIVFTMPVLDGYDNFTKFWIFIGFQWIVYIFQILIRAIVPDEPAEVQIQHDRNDFINKKLIHKELDEALEELRADEDVSQWNPITHIKDKLN